MYPLASSGNDNVSEPYMAIAMRTADIARNDMTGDEDAGLARRQITRMASSFDPKTFL